MIYQFLKCLKESKQTIYICYKFGRENTRTPVDLPPPVPFSSGLCVIPQLSEKNMEKPNFVSVQQPTFTCICTSSLGTPDYP